MKKAPKITFQDFNRISKKKKTTHNLTYTE